MDPDNTTQTDPSEDGFDDGFDGKTPTETPGSGSEGENEGAGGEGSDRTQQTQNVEPPPEYVQLTKTEREDLLARAALVEEIRAAQSQGLDKAFGKIGSIERTLSGITSAGVEIDQADIDALRDEFPPLAKALEKVRNLQVVGVRSQDPDPETLAKPALTKIEERNLRALARQHPDYQQIDADPAFMEWAKKRGESFVRQVAEASNDFDHVFIGQAMTDFKRERAAAAPPPPSAPSATRQSRIKAAVTPRGSGSQPAAEDPEAEFDAGFRGS